MYQMLIMSNNYHCYGYRAQLLTEMVYKLSKKLRNRDKIILYHNKNTFKITEIENRIFFPERETTSITVKFSKLK